MVTCIMVLMNYYYGNMVLLAPSVKALQSLMNICTTFANERDIVYNERKSVTMKFWPKRYKRTTVEKFC